MTTEISGHQRASGEDDRSRSLRPWEMGRMRTPQIWKIQKLASEGKPAVTCHTNSAQNAGHDCDGDNDQRGHHRAGALIAR